MYRDILSAERYLEAGEYCMKEKVDFITCHLQEIQDHREPFGWACNNKDFSNYKHGEA